MGAFRHLVLLCSRPCFHQSVLDSDREDFKFTLPQCELANVKSLAVKETDSEDWRLRLEMQAVLRHLEVRWQLFGEALSKFGDLEAMLAVCTGCVPRIPSYQKNSSLSLPRRWTSMDVTIDRITQLLPSAILGSTLDRDGNWGQLQPSDRAKAEASLEILRRSGDTGNEQGLGWLRGTRLCVLEDDTYTLCDQKGEIVEEGKRVVIWEQHNATWYIQGCVTYPFNSSP